MHSKGWRGPWRQQLTTAEEVARSVLVAIHELQCYSEAWARAILNRRLTEAVAGVIGPEVEFHHCTLHAKGPDYGAPFPCTISIRTPTDAMWTPSSTEILPMRRVAA
jgi:hypothetical protein